MMVKTWCERNGIKEAKYYYGLCQVRKAVLAGFNLELPADEEQPKLVRVDMTCLAATEGDANLASTAAEQPYRQYNHKQSVCNMAAGRLRYRKERAQRQSQRC